MAFVIRNARPEDRGILKAMVQEFIDHLGRLQTGGGSAAAMSEPDDGETCVLEPVSEAELDRCIDLALGPDPACHALVAERDDIPVGYLAWHWGVWDLFRCFHVAGLFVRGDVRSLGVGRALMEEARLIAEARGAERMIWMVWTKNRSAIEFYKGLGAELLEEDRQMVWKIGGRS